MSNTDATTLPPALRVKGIDHVTLVTSDLERGRKFYCDILGMEPTERPEFKFPGLWFRAGNTQVHLILEMDTSALAGDRAIRDDTGAGLAHHFAFEVDDAHAAAAALEERGVRIMGGPVPRPDGCIQVWFYDPDGYVVEVFHRPKDRPTL